MGPKMIHVEVKGYDRSWLYSITDTDERRIADWLLATVRREGKAAEYCAGEISVKVSERDPML